MYKTQLIKLGVFDSGLGGLSVVNHLKKLAPQYGINFKYSYLRDTNNFPYGTKSISELKEIVKNNIYKLYLQGNDDLIVACNTASIVAESTINYLSNHFSINIVKLSEGAKYSISALENSKKVMLIASKATIASAYYQRLFSLHYPQIKVVSVAAQNLISEVENLDESGCFREISNLKKFYDRNHFDSLFLGCTHYSLINERISKIFAHQNIVDPAYYTALHYISTKANCHIFGTNISNLNLSL